MGALTATDPPTDKRKTSTEQPGRKVKRRVLKKWQARQAREARLAAKRG